MFYIQVGFGVAIGVSLLVWAYVYLKIGHVAGWLSPPLLRRLLSPNLLFFNSNQTKLR